MSTALLTVLFVLLGVILLMVGVIGYIALRFHRDLMWFHSAGRSLAQHELERARVEVDKMKYEAELKKAENEAHRPRSTVSPSLTQRSANSAASEL